MFNTVSGKKLTILGYSYKKNTSDIRFSAAIDVCKTLVKERARLCVYDPRVASEAVSISLTTEDGAQENVEVCQDAYVASTAAHAILLLTEWDEFKRIDYQKLYDSMQKPAFIFDGRNLLDHAKLREIGFQVYAIGKAHQAIADGEEEKERKTMADNAALARVRAGAASKPQAEDEMTVESESRLHATESFGAMA